MGTLYVNHIWKFNHYQRDEKERRAQTIKNIKELYGIVLDACNFQFSLNFKL